MPVIRSLCDGFIPVSYGLQCELSFLAALSAVLQLRVLIPELRDLWGGEVDKAVFNPTDWLIGVQLTHIRVTGSFSKTQLHKLT